jgi:DNA polymerase-3 subunit alpha
MTRINRDLVKLSRESGIPLVATNDCHYLTRSDAHAQEVLMCIQTGKTMSDSQRMKFATDQFYFKTAEEMAQVFREIPDAVSRTVTIAERCNVKIQRVRQSVPRVQSAGWTHDGFVFRKSVRAKAFESRALADWSASRSRKIGCAIRLSDYERRLSDEIAMIQKMRFAGYFLIVWDFIHYARAQNISGRAGHGDRRQEASSATRCVLRTWTRCSTSLIFERFLNPERISTARYRYRLLHEPSRGSDRIRAREIWRKEVSPRLLPLEPWLRRPC